MIEIIYLVERTDINTKEGARLGGLREAYRVVPQN